jgi:hypothetical protein
LKFPPKGSLSGDSDRGRPTLIITAVLISAIWAFCIGVVVVHLNQLSDTGPTTANQRGTALVPAKPAAGNTDSGSLRESSRTAHIDPRAAVLSIHELPDYKVINSAHAARPGGGTDPHSWDRLFQKSQAGASDYRMTEAIVVAYGTSSEAMADVDQLRQAEELQGAKASPGVGAGQSTIWVEPAGVRGYALIRVVFRMDNVVAQVALLGQDEPMLADEAQSLADAQQARLLSLLHETS